MVSQPYLKKLFDLDGRSYTSPMAYLKRNVYLLWQIPEQEHEERLQEQHSLLQNIFIRESGEEETQLQKRKVSELTATLREALQRVQNDWTEQNVKKAIEPFIKSICYVSDEKPPQAWGWKFLRWVVTASAPGPALISNMVFLGKEETLARVSQAHQVAQDMDV
jgi:glutamyl-tRNA synthetase